MKKKLLLTLLLCSITLFVAFGEGQSEPSDGTVEIQYYFWEEPTTLEIVDAFNSSQDKIRVIPNPLPINDYEIKIQALLTAKENIDIFNIKTQVDIYNYIRSGFIQELENIDSAKGFDFSQYDSMSKTLKINNEYYSLPYRGAKYYIYFNKAIFDRLGEKYPEEYVVAGEWTWEKYEELADRITQKDPNVYGAYWHVWNGTNSVQIAQKGVKVVSDDGKSIVKNYKDIFFTDLRMRKKMEEKGSMWPYQDLKVSKMHYSTAFFSGKVAMLVIGEWFPGMLKNAREKNQFQGFTWDDWGVTRLPNDEKVYKVDALPTGSAITSYSKKKDAAFEFLKWLSGPGGADAVSKAGFLPPVVTDKVRKNFESLIPDKTSLERFLEPVEYASSPFFSEVSGLGSAYLDIVDKYLNSDASEDELLDEFDKKVQRLILESQ